MPKGRRGVRDRVADAVDAEPLPGAEDLAIAFARYGPQLLLRAERTLGSRPDAEDLVQEVMLEALQSADRETSARRLLHQVGWRARDRRRRARQPLPLSAEHQVSDPIAIAEARALLVAVVREQAPVSGHRLIRWLAGYSLADQALATGQPYSTVAMGLTRARKRAEQIRLEWLTSVLALLTRLRLRRRSRTRDVEDAGQVLAAPSHAALLAAAVMVTGAGAASWIGAPGRPPNPHGSVGAQRTQTSSEPRFSAVADMLVPRSPLGHPLAVEGRSRHLVAGEELTAQEWPVSPLAPTEEGPEDMQLTDAARSPNYDQDHTVVAIGMGAGCHCPALLRSTDGGATWVTASLSPPSAAHLVLPPDWPTDPSIFISNDAFGGVPDLVAASFGSPFVPLPAPPGQLVFSSRYSSGDRRLFIAGRGVVWSYVVGPTPRLAPSLIFPNPNSIATLATPADASSAVLVAAPDSPRASATALYACDTACSATVVLPYAHPPRLAVAPSEGSGQIIVATDGVNTRISTDGGYVFHSVSQPTAIVSIRALALTETDVWMVGATRVGDFSVVRAPVHNLRDWMTLSGDPALSSDGSVVPLDVERWLYLPIGRGFRCTADGGQIWSGRCPA